MKRQDHNEKAADLMRNDLTPEEKDEIISALEKEGLDREELEELTDLSMGIDKAFNNVPGEGMDNRFYSLLEAEQKELHQKDVKAVRKHFTNKYTWLYAAAGIALFIMGWFSATLSLNSGPGRSELADLSGEVRQLKETLVLTMMDQPSTVERIRAVNMISEFENPDSRIIDNLIRVLNTDNNDNVRLLALEALIKYSGNEEVRAGLIASISEQTSPMIQLRMAEIMIAMKEKRAIDEFRKLLDDMNLNYSVRSKIQEAVGTLL